jgi:hypothetical protein
MAKRTYEHVVRNGKPIAVRVPKGSVNDATTIKTRFGGGLLDSIRTFTAGR